MQHRLFKLWYEEPPGASILQPLSWLYGGAICARRSAYRRGWLRSHSIGRPVIVVGNLTVGGTGKTPLTIWIANQLRKRGAARQRGHVEQPGWGNTGGPIGHVLD